jgi:metal-responsive CopG/Arc/MetJ family transcriptional regulator
MTEKRFLTIQVDSAVIELIDKIVEFQGTNRSIFVRNSIREKIHEDIQRLRKEHRDDVKIQEGEDR